MTLTNKTALDFESITTLSPHPHSTHITHVAQQCGHKGCLFQWFYLVLHVMVSLFKIMISNHINHSV